jgi:argininosuccinate lyase
MAAQATLLGVLHGLPLAYSKDLQEDKEPLFDAVDTIELCLETLAGVLAGIEFDRERMAAAASDEMVAATDIADLLVRRGMPFREAHEVVGGLVRHALERDIALSEIGRERLAGFSELLDKEYYEVLAEGSWTESKLSEGGTSAAALAPQLERARSELDGLGA